ncbi:hypothetical protein NDU88_005171 [Pleurodeles waltl]|uniref:Uncharacterized protein n=1 Tax=Pleurodeles waltl TaxID=8319 RepID=A0AAV7SKW4_PLEWA|nr:hypothetical protein NDU88_005171 [Pleurodeles waltl]
MVCWGADISIWIYCGGFARKARTIGFGILTLVFSSTVFTSSCMRPKPFRATRDRMETTISGLRTALSVGRIKHKCASGRPAERRVDICNIKKVTALTLGMLISLNNPDPVLLPEWEVFREAQWTAITERGPDGSQASEEAGHAGLTIETGDSMLQLIYDSVKEHQTETLAESRRAWLVTKHLQGALKKVSTTCTKIGEKLNAIEERTSAVEANMGALQGEVETHTGQLSDIKWKMEDFENRQRQNNRQFTGIKKEVEGSNRRAFMIDLLKGAFPDLATLDWESEVQRVIQKGQMRDIPKLVSFIFVTLS